MRPVNDPLLSPRSSENAEENWEQDPWDVAPKRTGELAEDRGFAFERQPRVGIAAENTDVTRRSIHDADVLDLLRFVEIVEESVVQHLDADDRTVLCLGLFGGLQSVGVRLDLGCQSGTGEAVGSCLDLR